jgi:rubrerythrin
MSLLPPGFPDDVFGAFEVLKGRAPLSVEDLKVLAMIEVSGEYLYQAIARAAPDNECKALLKRNGQEERGHAHRMLKAIALKGGEFALPADGEIPFVRNTPQEIPTNAEFLEMLAGAEDGGDEIYARWADAEPDAEVARLLRLNGREEARHGERVNEVRKRLGMTA